MKPALLMLALLLAGCDNTPEHRYAQGLVLRDRDGCAFNVDAPGDSHAYLKFNRLESAASCTFKK